MDLGKRCIMKRIILFGGNKTISTDNGDEQIVSIC